MKNRKMEEGFGLDDRENQSKMREWEPTDGAEKQRKI